MALFDRYILVRAGLTGLWHALIPPGFAQGTDVRQSISLLLLAPLAAAGAANRRGRALLAATAVGLAFFCWGSRGELRFLLPVFPLWALASSEGMTRLASRSSERVLLGSLSLAAAASVLFMTRPAASPETLAYLSGKSDARAFQRAGGAPTPQIIDALNAMPDVRSVLFVGDAQSFGARFPCIAPTVFDRHPLAEEGRQCADAAALARRLRALGFSHIYYNSAELSRLRAAFQPLGWKDGTALAHAMDRLDDAGSLERVATGIDAPAVAIYRLKEKKSGE